MSNKQKIYLGPYLRVDRDALKKADIESIYDFTDGGALADVSCCTGNISDKFELAIPNLGLPFDRETTLTEDTTGVTQIEEIDIEFEKSNFYAHYKKHIDNIRKAVGVMNAVVCWGILIWWG